MPSLNIAYTQEQGYVTADIAEKNKLTKLNLSGGRRTAGLRVLLLLAAGYCYCWPQCKATVLRALLLTQVEIQDRVKVVNWT